MKEAPGQRRLPLGPPGPPPLVDLPLNPADDAPFLRPKSRARLRRTRRGIWNRSLLGLQAVAVLGLTATGTWVGYAKVMASNRLKIANLDVRGGRFLSEAEVRELLGPAVGENILMLDIDGLKARLRASSWVADVRIRRSLPDTLRVDIVEREPVALAEVERLYLMDGEGVLIDMYGPRTSGFDLPIVRGLARLDSQAHRDRAQRAGALLRDLGELAREVSEVHAESSGDMRVVLRGAGEVLLMREPYRPTFLAFLGVRKEIRERAPGAEYFDLRFRDRIYAKQPPPPPTAAAVPPAVVQDASAEGR